MPLLFETHRDGLLNDLYYTLQIIDLVPEIRLCADLSHFVVDREFRSPIPEIDQEYIHRVLERSDCFQGRIANREQVQIQINFPQHQEWVEIFKGWWKDGMRMWRNRNDDNATLVFLCELGPRPYAITGRPVAWASKAIMPKSSALATTHPREPVMDQRNTHRRQAEDAVWFESVLASASSIVSTDTSQSRALPAASCFDTSIGTTGSSRTASIRLASIPASSRWPVSSLTSRRSSSSAASTGARDSQSGRETGSDRTSQRQFDKVASLHLLSRFIQ